MSNMGVRPFAGIQTITGTPQPVFGTPVSAAFTPPPDPYLNNNSPAANQTQVTVTVTSTAGFLAGDVVAVGPTAAFVPGVAAGSGPDMGTIKLVVDATHLIIQGLIKPHAAAEWVVLNETAGNVHIRPVVTAAVIYIGNSSTLAANNQYVMDVLPIVAAGAAPAYWFDAESIGQSQPFNLSQFWALGTAGDTFVPRFEEI
jgi:hypothetical protein